MTPEIMAARMKKLLYYMYIDEYLDRYINNNNTNWLGYMANHLELSKSRTANLMLALVLHLWCDMLIDSQFPLEVSTAAHWYKVPHLYPVYTTNRCRAGLVHAH